MKNLKSYIFAVLFFIVLAAAIIFVKNTGAECLSDSDCVASSCCHATSCVPASQKPECPGIMCTEECQPNTLDCGQGSCSCVNGECKIRWKK